jgi:hypothetical protein
MNFLLSPDGRRAAAFGALLGGGIAMTIYAAFAMWLVRSVAQYVLWLGLAAHVAVLVVLTGFAGLLVKRMVRGSVAGASFEVSDQSDIVTTTTVTALEKSE